MVPTETKAAPTQIAALETSNLDDNLAGSDEGEDLIALAMSPSRPVQPKPAGGRPRPAALGGLKF